MRIFLLVFLNCLVFKAAANDFDLGRYIEDDLGEVKPSLEMAYGRWKSLDVDSYTYEVVEACECMTNGRSKVWVVKGEIVKFDSIDPGEITSGSWLPMTEAYTLENWFQRVKRISSELPDEIRVKFNKKYGYLEELYVNKRSAVYDDEVNVRIGNVKRLTRR